MLLCSHLHTVIGLEYSHKQLILALLDGNTELLGNEMRSALKDKKQIEAARQQFLINPGLADMMGIDKETVEDPELWAKLLDQGSDALLNGEDGTDEWTAGLFNQQEIDEEEVVVDTSKRRFGKMNRAA